MADIVFFQSTPLRTFGLIGYPLSHSFSKKYFTEKFSREQINDCRYELYPIRSVDEVKQLIRSFPHLKGLNVTIPYKQQIIKLLTDASEIPEGIRACNCIKIEGKILIGYNTDCIGFEKSFTPLLQPHHKKALVLGTGGAAAAVVYVLKKLGINFTSVSRSPLQSSVIKYSDLNEKKLKEYNIIINTTPLGMYPQTDSCPPLPYQAITEKFLLYDLVYNPAQTLFLSKGAAKGAAIKNGEEMLILQAEESWKIWNS
ncbi:MAG TPA: shikimate dehydrogenase [Chitinophagaceae bacterium]|nr:shikimate dehydrogenase [Chitinophagaceae bacterium]